MQAAFAQVPNRDLLESFDIEGLDFFGESHRQQLVNHGNVLYSGTLKIGGQRFQAVLDTSSVDLHVFAKHCKTCGPTPEKLYDDIRSKTFEEGDLVAVKMHNGLTTHSAASRETVQLGPFEAAAQQFWEVFAMDSRNNTSLDFQAILGVGPPADAKKLGAMQAVDQSKHARVFVEEVGIHVMSMCLGKDSLSPGVFVWNDASPATRPVGMFMEVPISGSGFWSAGLRDMKLGSSMFDCHDDNCLAIIDTSTPFIVAPKSAAERFAEVMRASFETDAGCEDLSTFPDLEFSLGGQTLTLPPESYMAKLVGEVSPELRRLLPSASRTSSDCVAMVVSATDIKKQDDTKTWVLGLPLIRKYYTSFVLDSDFHAERMFFAEASTTCNPLDGEELMRSQMEAAGVKRQPLRLDATKLRIPRAISAVFT